MKQKLTLLIAFSFLILAGFSQSSNGTATDQKIQDSIATAKKDSTKWAVLEANLIYPWFNAGKWSGVSPVQGIDYVPDPSKQYNLIFDFTHYKKDTNNINAGLTEIARIINLHVAAGIPKDHIHPVIISHAKALFSLYNNNAYQAKFKKDNPNIKIVNEMMSAGIKFIACGQAMNFLDIKKEQFYPGVKVALSAKTTLSYYIQQGYMRYDIDELD